MKKKIDYKINAKLPLLLGTPQDYAILYYLLQMKLKFLHILMATIFISYYISKIIK